MATKRNYVVLACLLCGMVSCAGRCARDETMQRTFQTGSTGPPDGSRHTVSASRPDSPSEARMRGMGLVDLAETDAEIRVELLYATPDNFMGVVLYPDIRKAFLLPEAAAKLTKARRLLQAERPELTLLVYDAARPFAVQKRMWEEAVRLGKTYYVADPAKGGGLHNFGAAVDATLAEAATGTPLPMGTPYDHLAPESNTDREEDLLGQGTISRAEYENRRLLRRVMTEAGFLTVKSEWWHFNHVRREEALRTLKRID